MITNHCNLDYQLGSIRLYLKVSLSWTIKIFLYVVFVPITISGSFTIMHGSVINSPQVVALYGDDSILVVESAENWWPRAQSRGHVVDFAQFRYMKGGSHS